MAVKNGLYVEVNGDRFWYKDDKLHREDGPAVVWADGSCEWYRDDHRHREDGPAAIWTNGSCEWYYQDIKYSFEAWCEVTNRTPEAATLLRLKYDC